MTAAASGSGDQPPNDPPKGPNKVPLTVYEWTEALLEDCMSYDRTFFCKCRQCQLYFSKNKPHVDPYILELGGAVAPRYSYLGFVNARRAAAARRELDRTSALLAKTKEAAEKRAAERKAAEKKTVEKKAAEKKANANDPKSREPRDPKEKEEQTKEQLRKE